MENEPATFTRDFALNYMWFKMLSDIADLVASHLAAFTPGGLELAIQEDWSLVNSVLELPAAERRPYFDSILAEASESKMPVEILDYIEPNALISDIENVLPEHAAVLLKNLKWVEGEISRVRYLANLTKA